MMTENNLIISNIKEKPIKTDFVMAKKVYEFLATGFEDIEALIPLDIMRRAGVDFKTVSITGNRMVESAHGVAIQADLLFEEADLKDADLLMLPGGLPGATNLNDHVGVRRALLEQNKEGKLIAAICAAPMVPGALGLLSGKRATCYPGFEKELIGAEITVDDVTVDGKVITSRGPATAMALAVKLAELMTDKAL